MLSRLTAPATERCAEGIPTPHLRLPRHPFCGISANSFRVYCIDDFCSPGWGKRRGNFLASLCLGKQAGSAPAGSFPHAQDGVTPLPSRKGSGVTEVHACRAAYPSWASCPGHEHKQHHQQTRHCSQWWQLSRRCVMLSTFASVSHGHVCCVCGNRTRFPVPMRAAASSHPPERGEARSIRDLLHEKLSFSSCMP